MTEQYTTAYYRATYEIRYAASPLSTNGPVHVLMHSGRWTDEGKQRSAAERRRLKHAEGEIREVKLAAGTFTLRPGRCEVCLEAFVGPPNRRRCDGCGKKRG